MQASQKLELRVGLAVLGLLIFFMSLTIIAVKKFGIDLPGCVTNVAAFTKGQVIERAPAHFEIHYVARMWAFDPPQVELPTGAEVDIYLNSVDVNHGFQILGTNVNLMAVPGAVNYAHIHFTKAGKYFVVCHEYCGTGHQNMIATILVSDFGSGHTSSALAESSIELTGNAKLGAALVVSKSCTACHSLDKTLSVGPSFRGLWGKTEELSDGSKVLVDAAYIRESILQPKLKIVKGYQPLMPQLQISNQEIEQITAFLISIK